MAYTAANKFAQKIDEQLSSVAQAQLVTNNDFDWAGVKTVNVYSVPTATMTDYTRSGNQRYGSPTDLGNTAQELTVTKDRSFTYVIDRGDKEETQMSMDAGKSLSRQLKLVVAPEYDTYVFAKLAEAAKANEGFHGETVVTAKNAYAEFLAAQEALGDANVPDAGRVALCSYKFANFLKQDPAFMKYSDLSQNMVIKGVMGEVDGTRIVKVPKAKLPAGTDFILTHPMACCAPKKLESYKIHMDPPGISGWLVEGRIIYDAFVLTNKKSCVYYHGSPLA